MYKRTVLVIKRAFDSLFSVRGYALRQKRRCCGVSGIHFSLGPCLNPTSSHKAQIPYSIMIQNTTKTDQSQLLCPRLLLRCSIKIFACCLIPMPRTPCFRYFYSFIHHFHTLRLVLFSHQGYPSIGPGIHPSQQAHS